MCKALLLILLWLTWVGLKKENKWVLGSGTRLFLPELLKPLQMEKLFHFVPSCVSHYDWNMEEGLLRRDLACRSIILVVYHFVILVILSLPVVDCRCPLMAIVGRWDSWTDIFLRETSPLLSPFTFRVFLRKYFHKKKSYQRDKERFEVELNKELCVPKHLGEIKLPEPQCMKQPDSLQ